VRALAFLVAGFVTAGLSCVDLHARPTVIETADIPNVTPQPPQMRPVYDDLVYPEGLVFDGSTLLFTDMKLGMVFRFDGQSVTALWKDNRCGPTSLAKLPSGLWLVACHHSGELVFLDLSDLNNPRVTAREPFYRPNDMHASVHGVYVSSSGEFDQFAPHTGAVWLIRSPRNRRRVASGLHYANGVAVTKDGHSLLVSEHFPGRVWRFVIRSDGALGERRPAVWLYTSWGHPLPKEGPDGIETATDGSYFVAYYLTAEVVQVSPDDKMIKTFATHDYPRVTNVALTPDGRGLYAVASNATETKGALFYIDLKDRH
jgi:gluconolactonase